MQKYVSKVPIEGKTVTKQEVSANKMFQAPQHLSSWYSMKRTKQASKGLCGWPSTHCLSPLLGCIANTVSAIAGRIMTMGH